MNQKAVRAWMMYDWANSAYSTTILAAVLPIFYGSVAASGLDDTTAQSYYSFTHSIGMLCVALLAPLLGAVADISGKKIAFLRAFALLGMAATLGFAFVQSGQWQFASVLLVISTIGFASSNTFYDALLPDLVPSEQRNLVSAKGYAYGYLGGGLLLAVNILMIEKFAWFGLPDTLSGTRLAFISVSVWWLVFSIPIFTQIKNLPRQTEQRLKLSGYAAAASKRIARTFRSIRRYPQLLKFLAAFWFYNDGINTIVLLATIYGEGIGIGTSHLILALLITQFIGIPCTILLGKIAQRIGSKTTLYFTLSLYVIIVMLGYNMTEALHFYLLAAMVGLVQGGSKSISRAIFSDLMPQRQTGEFFGFVNITSKFSSIVGPFVFGLVGKLTGSSQLAILSLIFFFVVGIVLMAFVNIEKGMEDAAAVDRRHATEAPL